MQKGSDFLMLGIMIKQYMDENGIKQVFVSEKTGIRPQILGVLLKGERKIEVKEFFSICMAIGLNPIEFAVKAGIYIKEQETAKEK